MMKQERKARTGVWEVYLELQVTKKMLGYNLLIGKAFKYPPICF